MNTRFSICAAVFAGMSLATFAVENVYWSMPDEDLGSIIVDGKERRLSKDKFMFNDLPLPDDGGDLVLLMDIDVQNCDKGASAGGLGLHGYREPDVKRSSPNGTGGVEPQLASGMNHVVARLKPGTHSLRWDAYPARGTIWKVRNTRIVRLEEAADIGAVADGARRFSLKLPGVDPMRHLVVEHELVSGDDTSRVAITLVGVNGNRQTVEMRFGCDLRDWLDLAKKPNCGTVNIYRSCKEGEDRVLTKTDPTLLAAVSGSVFDVDSGLGPVARVDVEVLGAGTFRLRRLALRNVPVEYPDRPVFKLEQLGNWIPVAYPEKLGILKGSALDRSDPGGPAPTGAYGRIVKDGEGHVVAEKRPGKPIRMLTTGLGEIGTYLADAREMPFLVKEYAGANGGHLYAENHVCGWSTDLHDLLEAAVENCYRAGYRNIDFYGDGTTQRLTQNCGLDWESDPEAMKALDALQWSIKCIKDRGMTITWNIGGSFYKGKAWNPETWDKRAFYLKERIYWDEEARRHWTDSVRKMFTAVNPYTNLALVDDPVLVAVDCWNEQVFDFAYEVTRAWTREELKRRHGTIEALKKAWKLDGESWKDFSEIPLSNEMLGKKDERGAELCAIALERERDLFGFYRAELKKIGFKGLVTNTNMNKSFRHMLVRSDATYVSQNAYHAHPMGHWNESAGSIVGECNLVRSFLATKAWRLPFFISEGDICWWNSHRYEQAFALNAYGALNGMSAIKTFAGGGVAEPKFTYRARGPRRLDSWSGRRDPIKWATEFLNYYIFAQGAVEESPLKLRVDLNEGEIVASRVLDKAVATAQTLPSLFCSVSAAVIGDKPPPPRERELAVPRDGASDVTYTSEKFMSVIDSKSGGFDFGKYLKLCREKGWVDAGNRTNPAKKIWESCTGQLYLDAAKEFGAINTPTVHGVFAKAGTVYDRLAEVDVQEMTTDGALCVVSVDGKPIAESRRMVVVYATDAQNSGMTFRGPDMGGILTWGGPPVVLKTGRIHLSIKNVMAGGFKCWALLPDGTRNEPVSIGGGDGLVDFALDTAKLEKGGSVFFELSLEQQGDVALGGQAKDVLPSEQHLEWADCEIGVIIHQDVQVYEPTYDFRKQWGYMPSPSVFNPSSLDTDQWIKTAKAAGAKYAILVAKHCSGFSLWPTKAHDYSVASSPWKDGKGDVVADFVASCRKFGVRPGLYASTGTNARLGVDQFNIGDSTKWDAYRDIVKTQLSELWSNYGALFEIWFDGGNLPYDRGGREIEDLLVQLQPNAVVFQGNPARSPSLRWCGNERGAMPEVSWNRSNRGTGSDGVQEETGADFAGDFDGKYWIPAEADTPNREKEHAFQCGWIWHAGEDGYVYPAETLLDKYFTSVGRGANMLIGMVIDNRGLVPDVDAREFRRFGELVSNLYAQKVASAAGEANCLFIEVKDGARPNLVSVQEDIRFGERVRNWELWGFDGRLWHTLHHGLGIGHRRLVKVRPGAYTRYMLAAWDHRGERQAQIRDFSLYECDIPLSN